MAYKQSRQEKLAKLDELRKMYGLDNLDEEGGIDKQNKLRMLRDMDKMASEVDDIGDINIFSQYCPPGVKRVLASGTDAWIGEVDSSTVMKYPKAPGGDMTRLVTERKFLEVVGHHERIIALKGFCDTGIYLERAINGNLLDYMLESENPSPSLQQRLSWCQEAAEAVVWIHSKSVLHRDIQPSNLLLDEGLHVKLADFQGQHLSEDGTTLLDGWTAGSCRFSCPSDDLDVANVKTDLFALGCTIYFIMMGHAVFPDIIDGEDGYPAKVEDRFARQQFPQDTHACSSITLKCWQKEYESASELLLDLKAVREGVSNTACT